MTLPARLWANIEKGDRRDFLVSPDETLSYADIAHGIKCWMATFDTAGLVPGDRFVLRTKQEGVAIAAFLAGLVDGIVPVLLEASCPNPRLASIVTVVEPKLVVSDKGLPDLPDTIVGRVLMTPQQRGGLRGLLGRKQQTGFGLSEKETTRPPRLPDEDGLAYLLFTSGTTSEPSGVKIMRSNLAANLDTISRLADHSSASRIFNDMILAHADGLVQGPLLTAWNGSAVLRAGGFEVHKIEEWLSYIRQFRATHVLTVPTIWAMIDRYAAHDDYFDAPECRTLMTVAAKMPEDLWQRIETRFERPLFNQYGLTETVTSGLYSGNHPEMGPRFTLGRPIDCEARIANDAPEGELELRGDNVFSGYWNNEARTQASFTDDGWFRTGDLAKLRKDGSFEILGRLKTVIMSGGVLIKPDEVDEAMLRHPAVAESATVGVPDGVFGEIGLTGVVLTEEIDEITLAEHLRAYIEPRKIPMRIVALDQIPRGPSGKAKLKELRALLSEVSGDTKKATEGEDIEATVLAIGAKVFRIPVERLSLRSTPDEIEGWDSFTQLNLVLSIEDHIERQIPASRVSAWIRLGDFVDAIRETA